MSQELFDENGECLYEVETDEVMADGYGIDDAGQFYVDAENGMTDIRVVILEKNMQVVVEAYLKMHPEWNPLHDPGGRT